MPRVVVGGLPYFGRKLAALLDGDGWRVRYLETRGWQVWPALTAVQHAARADLVYMVGGQVARYSRPHLLRQLLRVPVVMHWAGSDVLHAHQTLRRGQETDVLVRGVTHWAGAPWLVAELSALGVRATWVPHSWVRSSPPMPLPSGPFTVVAYLPAARLRFYGAERINQIAAALPEARVLVVGTDTLPGAPPNVQPLGWVEGMEAVYRQAHALVRLPHHDGLAFMVQESLALGRYAVWNYPFPGAELAHTTAEAVVVLRRLMQQHQAGVLLPNQVGMTHTLERFSAARIRQELRDGFTSVLTR